MARGGHALRARRSELLPALHAVQDRIGWISQPALNYISRRLAVPPAEAYGVATFYALYATKPQPPTVAHVCDDIACRIAGAERICDDLRRAVGPEGEAARDGSIGWKRSPCLGLCELAPAALVTTAGEVTRRVSLAPADAAAVVSRLEGRDPLPRPQPALRQTGGDTAPPAVARGCRRSGVAGGLPRARRIRARCDVPSRSAPRRSSPRSPRRSSWGGAVPPSRPDGSGPRSPPSLPSRSTSCATPTSRSPARSRTGSCSRATPYAVIEAMTIAGFAIGANQGLPLPARRVPGSRARRVDRHRRGPHRRPPRSGHPGIRLHLRHRAAARGRRVHLWRGDGPVRVDRGQARRAAEQAAVPGRGRAVRQADRREQRGDAGQHPTPPARSAARNTRAIGTEGSTGPKLFCLSGNVARPGHLRSRVRGDAARPHRARRRGQRHGRDPGHPAGRGRRRVRRARRARPATHLRGDTGRRGHARIGRDHGLRRDRSTSWTPCAASRSSSATSRAGNASRAESAASARRSCWRDWPRGRGCVRATTSWCCCARSARPCATRRSVGSARPRRRPSSRRCASPDLVAL